MDVQTIKRASSAVMGASSIEVLMTAVSTRKQTYRRFAKNLHPDTYPCDIDEHTRQRALEAYKRLQELYAGTDSLTTAKASITTIVTKHASHTVIAASVSGDICATFSARSVIAARGVDSFIKMARTPRDNHLLENEQHSLKQLSRPTKSEQYQVFVPKLIDHFVADNHGKRCRANVMHTLDGLYPLSAIIDASNALDPLDVVWMWRRLLVALAYAHDNNVIHGAVMPEHVMIQPEQHGLVLVDWCYSVRRESDSYAPIRAIVGARRDWYPVEVLAKQSPSAATDLLLAARTMINALGGDPVRGTLPQSVPRQLRAFFRGCLASSQTMRPQNAWLLLQEFDELLESMGAPYYPRRFRQFTMPHGMV